MRFARAAVLSLSLSLSLSFGCSSGGGGGADSSAAGAAAGDAAPVTSFDTARFEQRANDKMAAVLKKPSVEAAMNGAWDEIGTDPAVGAAGQSMFSAIGSHPSFTPVAAGFMAKLQESPRFIALVTAFMQKNGNDLAGFEAKFGQHVDAQIARPEVQGALDASIGRLIEKPEIQGALTKLVQAITVETGISQEFGRKIGAKLESRDIMSKIEAKAGTKPGDADYEEKVFSYLTADERLERFMIGFADLFAKHAAPRKAVADLLQNPAVVGATSEQVANMMKGPSFYTLAEDALVAALDGSDRPTVEAKLDALLAQPEVVTAFAAWVEAIAAVPEVKQGFGDAFQQLFASDEFTQLLMTTFVE